MPTWWIVGVAIYVPLFLLATVVQVRDGTMELGTAVIGGSLFLALSTASAVFWFG